MSINAIKKARVGRPAVDSEAITVRAARDLLKAVDAAARKEADKPGRPEMLRRIARDWLTDHGFLKPAPLDPKAVATKIAALDAKAAALKHDGTKSPANALKTMDRAIVKGKAQGLRKRLAKAKGK